MPLLESKKFSTFLDMKKVYILATSLCLGQPSWAQIRDFQTTRLNSTAGAGVASILSTEAAILNPAASAFYEGSSFSYQSFSTSLRRESSARQAAGDNFDEGKRAQGLFLSDHSTPLKGGVGYTRQDENNYEREKMIFHGSAPVGPNASIGVRYNYIQDTYPSRASKRHATHHQTAFGATYVVDEKTTLGLVIFDPTRTTRGEERAIAGFQYSMADRLTLIADVGTQYTKDAKKKHLWRAAIQVNVFSDFFVRAGRFSDNVLQTKGMGWGASWIGPRLGVEFAQKISDQFGEEWNYVYKDETLVDTSLSAIIKF
jgi:hypothetical protein